MKDSSWKKARVWAAKKWQEKHSRPAHDGFLRIRITTLSILSVGACNRLARTSADDPEKERSVKEKAKVTRKVTMAETTKPLKSG